MEIIVIILVLWIWMSVVGVVAVLRDATINSFQRKSQIVVSIIFPIIGPLFILHLVNEHSPEAIPRFLIPWPFRSILFGKTHPRNKNRDDNEGQAHDLNLTRRYNSHSDNQSGGGGAGGD